MEAEMKAKLGKVYREKLHGIEGVATARTEFLTGCSRVSLQYVRDNEIKSIGVDEPLLELVGDGPELGEAATGPAKKKGGPRPAVPRAVAP